MTQTRQPYSSRPTERKDNDAVADDPSVKDLLELISMPNLQYCVANHLI